MTPADVVREMRNLVNDSKGLELKRELILWSHWIEAAMEDRRRLREALDRYAEQATAEIERLTRLLTECDGKLGRKPCQYSRCMELVNAKAEIERLQGTLDRLRIAYAELAPDDAV
jgi:hypothetical protein